MRGNSGSCILKKYQKKEIEARRPIAEWRAIGPGPVSRLFRHDFVDHVFDIPDDVDRSGLRNGQTG
jgi:hypothetical protein